MSFLNQIPTMDRDSLRELKKGIDLSFKDFSRAYGDAIEGFFDPLLTFLIWLEKLLVIHPVANCYWCFWFISLDWI